MKRKRPGSKFEKWFRDKMSKYALVYKFRDAAIINPKSQVKIPVPSDFRVMKNGQTVFVECKSSTKYLTKSQFRDVQLKFGDKAMEEKFNYVYVIWDATSDYVYCVHHIRMKNILSYISKPHGKVSWELIQMYSFYTQKRKKFSPEDFFNLASSKGWLE